MIPSLFMISTLPILLFYTINPYHLIFPLSQQLVISLIFQISLQTMHHPDASPHGCLFCGLHDVTFSFTLQPTVSRFYVYHSHQQFLQCWSQCSFSQPSHLDHSAFGVILSILAFAFGIRQNVIFLQHMRFLSIPKHQNFSISKWKSWL